MLEDKGTLQFILDTVFKLGGAPQKLDMEPGEGRSTEPVYQVLYG